MLNLNIFYIFLSLGIFINLIYSIYDYKKNKNKKNNYILLFLIELKNMYEEKILFGFVFVFYTFFLFFFIINLLIFFKILLIFLKIFFYKITKKNSVITIKEYPWSSLGYTVGYISISKILYETYRIIKFEINKKSFLLVYNFFSKEKKFDIKIVELFILRWFFNIPIVYLLKCSKLILLYKKFSKSIDEHKTFKIKIIIKFKNIFFTIAAFLKNDLKDDIIPTDYVIFKNYKIIIINGIISRNGKEKYPLSLQKAHINGNKWVMSGSLIDKKYGVKRDFSGKIKDINDHLFFYQKEKNFNCSLTTTENIKFGSIEKTVEIFKPVYVWDIDQDDKQYFCLYKKNETFDQRFVSTDYIQLRTWNRFNFDNRDKYLDFCIRSNLYLQNTGFTHYLKRGVFSEIISTNEIENTVIKELIKKTPSYVLLDFFEKSHPSFNALLLEQYEINKKNVLNKEDFIDKFKNF